MKQIKWTVQYLTAPTALRYCKHCGVKTTFVSSGLFRVNAQQKSLDIWLIFKCQHCDTTWNCTILSRANPGTLQKSLLQGFHTNDETLAMQYATDAALLKRNGAAPGVPQLALLGPDVGSEPPVCIELTAPWPAEYKAAAAIRQKLGLSRSQFDQLCESGRLTCLSGQNLKKCNLAGTFLLKLT